MDGNKIHEIYQIAYLNKICVLQILIKAGVSHLKQFLRNKNFPQSCLKKIPSLVCLMFTYIMLTQKYYFC